MKKLITLLLALSMIFCFAACGGNGGGTVTGETYDAGNVSVLVPNGWKAFPVSDMWSDDADATDPDQVNIVKGGESEFDLLTKPYIQVVHYEPDSMMTPSKDFYTNAEDVDAVTTGDLKWEGFRAEGLLGDSIIIMWTTAADGHQYQINVYDETDAGKIAMTDADVQAILASITNA